MRLIQSALRWATGDPLASFYDLRHQAFSARAIEVWGADATGSDAQLWIHMSKRSGHAGPTSTEAYIHQIEGAMADAAKRERPSAWSGSVPAMDSGVFVLLESLVVDMEPSVPAPLISIALGAPASAVDFRKRLGIVRHVANGLKLKAVAGAEMLSEEQVEAAVRDQAQAIEMAGRSVRPVNATVHAQCAAISSQFLLARASLQPKYAPLVNHFDQLVIVGKFVSLQRLWQHWLICQKGVDLDVSNAIAGAPLVQMLLDAGVPAESIVVLSHKSFALDARLRKLGIPQEERDVRKGQPRHRLFFTETGVEAVSSRAATISVQGLHWLMLTIGAALHARERHEPGSEA